MFIESRNYFLSHFFEHLCSCGRNHPLQMNPCPGQSNEQPPSVVRVKLRHVTFGQYYRRCRLPLAPCPLKRRTDSINSSPPRQIGTLPSSNFPVNRLNVHSTSWSSPCNKKRSRRSDLRRAVAPGLPAKRLCHQVSNAKAWPEPIQFADPVCHPNQSSPDLDRYGLVFLCKGWRCSQTPAAG